MAKKNKTEQFYTGKVEVRTLVGKICQAYNLPFDEVMGRVIRAYPQITNKKRCANCNAGMKILEYKIDYYDVLLLKTIGDKILERKRNGIGFTEANKIHVQSLDVTYTAKSRTSQCRHMGLLAKVMKKNSEGKLIHDQEAGWAITKRGFELLRNEPVQESVKVFRDEILERSEKLITMQEIISGKDNSPFNGYDRSDYINIAGLANGKLF